MSETAQQSQEKYASDSSAIFAFAIRSRDYFNIYAEFFTYSARFNYLFPRRRLASVISQIDQALADGEHYLYANGRKYPISASLLQKLRQSLSVVSNGGSDAQVSESGTNDTQAARPLAEKQASAMELPSRQISMKTRRINKELNTAQAMQNVCIAKKTNGNACGGIGASRPNSSFLILNSSFVPIHSNNGRTSVVVGSRKL